MLPGQSPFQQKKSESRGRKKGHLLLEGGSSAALLSHYFEWKFIPSHFRAEKVSSKTISSCLDGTKSRFRCFWSD
jgi:hypothetical protein